MWSFDCFHTAQVQTFSISETGLPSWQLTDRTDWQNLTEPDRGVAGILRTHDAMLQPHSEALHLHQIWIFLPLTCRRYATFKNLNKKVCFQCFQTDSSIVMKADRNLILFEIHLYSFFDTHQIQLSIFIFNINVQTVTSEQTLIENNDLSCRFLMLRFNLIVCSV